MVERTRLTRRDFLKVSIVTIVGATIQACAKGTAVPEPTKPPVAPPTATTKPAAAPAKFNEAPMLAELVKAGKLPPVAERLPKEPLVLPVVESTGQYGGTIRSAWIGRSAGGPGRFWEEALVHFSTDGTKLEPNVFSKWEITDGGKTFTFKLREGMKWSDGTPVTADDFVYWYEDVIQNKELTPAFPTYLKAGGEPAVLEKVDDYTLRFKYKAVFPLFVLNLAEPKYTIVSSKYMKQFHIKYADKAKLDAAVKEAKFENWFQLYGSKATVYDNPDLPTWHTWVTKTPMSEPHYVNERNPYYWKVDPAGNQLPYVDKVTYDLVQDLQLFPTKVIGGELDLQWMYLNLDQYPILKENEKKGDYRVLIWKSTLGNSFQVMFNQSFDADPVIAKYITNKKFRQALSVAINRDDFNRVLFLGRAVPRQATVMDSSPDFKPEFAKRYTQYDTTQANKWLDELGLDKKDGEGYRIAPENGQPLTLTIFAAAVGNNVQGSELIKEYWKAVGIKAAVKAEDQNIHYQRMTANELQLSTWGMDGALYPLWLNYAYWIVPWVQGSSRIGPAFGLYRDSGGQKGKKPEGDIARALDLYDQAVAEADDAKRIALCSQVHDIMTESLWAIGTVLIADAPVVVKNNLRNVPETAPSDWMLRTVKNGHPEQFYFKK